MDDNRLTDDDLRNIRTQTEAYDLDGHWVSSVGELESIALAQCVPMLLDHIDALDGQVAGLSGSLRAVKDELQMLISGAEKRGYRVTEVRNLKAVVYAIDEALKRNGATYD